MEDFFCQKSVKVYARIRAHVQPLQVPLVLRRAARGTSIVLTPTDAIVTFRKSGIDALFMDDVYLTAQT
jgi:predicted NodU family carbamoyl transferase